MPITTVRTAALAAALALTAAAPLAAPLGAQATEQPDQRPTLFVVEFRNGAIGRAADYEPLAKGLPDLIASELAANPALRVVDRDNLQRIIDEQNLSASGRVDDATAVKAGRILGAHHYIKGVFVIQPNGRLRMDAQAVETETSRVEHVESVTGNADDVLDLIATLSKKMNAGLKLPPIPDRPAEPARPEPARPEPATGTATATTPAAAGTTTVVVATNPTPERPAPAQLATTTSTRITTAPPPRTTARAKKKGANFESTMLYSRALVEEDRGNVQGAIALYRKALDVFPEYTTARARLARLEKR